MIIYSHQMELLARQMRIGFEKQVIEHLREKYPLKTQNITEEEMHIRISQGIVQAENYNILSRRDVRIFLEFLINFGMEFYKDPSYDWASRILRIRNLNGREKINRLLKKINS